MTTAEIIDRLKQATADLGWMSEADYPFEVLCWDRGTELTPTALFKDSTPTAIAIETRSLADFFAPALQTEDWYDEEELANVDRYQQLVSTIEANLSETQVFRVGEIEIDAYIVGKTSNGELVGLKTKIVET